MELLGCREWLLRPIASGIAFQNVNLLTIVWIYSLSECLASSCEIENLNTSVSLRCYARVKAETDDIYRLSIRRTR